MRHFPSKIKLGQQGAGLITVLVFISFLLILLGLLLNKLENEFASGTITYHNLQALNLAEAGIEKAIYELNRTNGTYTGEKNAKLGQGQFTVTVKSATDGYLITSIGETRSAKKYTGKKIVSAHIQQIASNRWKIISWQEN
ncbi:MAG: hypothetical protein QME64_05710 [bacterium]|nr:hypothetical protein [bacterium]